MGCGRRPTAAPGAVKVRIDCCCDSGGATVIKAEIVERAAAAAGVTKTQAGIVIDRTLDVLKEALKRSERIELRGFGVFEVRRKKEGIGRNPKTGVVIPIPEGKAIRFKPGKNIKSL